MDFDMLFGNFSFNKGYSLCMMSDFQNCLISPVFSVFLKRFFAHKSTKLLVN